MILDDYNLIFIEVAFKKLGYKADLVPQANYRQKLYGHLNEVEQWRVADYIDGGQL